MGQIQESFHSSSTIPHTSTHIARLTHTLWSMASSDIINITDTTTIDHIHELDVSANVFPLVLDRKLTIPQFLEAPFPEVIISPSDLSMITPSSCIGDRVLKWTKNDILAVEIPNSAWLVELKQILKACFKKGTRAQKKIMIVHPTQRKLILPPWIVTLWLDIMPVVKQRKQWRTTVQWLSQCLRTQDTIAADQAISTMSWGMNAKPVIKEHEVAPVTNLSVFASNEWLAEWHLKLIATILNTSEPLDGQDWWIADTLLAFRIWTVQQSSGQIIASEDKSLMEYTKTVQDGKYTQIFLPTHINGNHWILFHADIQRRTFSYGTSPSLQSHVNTLEVLPSCSTAQAIPSTRGQVTNARSHPIFRLLALAQRPGWRLHLAVGSRTRVVASPLDIRWMDHPVGYAC